MHGFPFDSQITGADESGLPLYDRASNSEELARLIHAFFTDGIFGTGGFNAAASGGMNVTVSGGDVLVQGRYKHFEEGETFTLTAAAQPRIASIVIRLDLSLGVRDIVLDVVYGTASASPRAPALTRNATVYELGVYNVLIGAGSVSVLGKDITDTRMDNSRCGYVVAAMEKFDTTTFYRQIESDLAYFKENEQQEFEAWFAGLETILEGDVAGNLASMVIKRPVMVVSETSVPAYWLPADDLGTYKAYADADVKEGDVVKLDLTELTADNHAEKEAAWSTVWKARVYRDGRLELLASSVVPTDLFLKVTALRMEASV